jgi:AcrR family transcriptional regulator
MGRLARLQRPRHDAQARRERERAAHRKDIMDAALRVFARRGFGAATLDEVAQEAEFSKGALYLYFTSKEDILFNILFTMSTTIITGFKETLSGERTFREELHDLLVNTAEFSFRNRDTAKVVMAQHVAGFTSLSEEGRRKLFDIHNEIVDVLRTRTRKAYDDGELRNLPTEAIASIIHGSIDSMATMRWNLESLEKAKCAVDVFLDIIFKGIAKEKENCA